VVFNKFTYLADKSILSVSTVKTKKMLAKKSKKSVIQSLRSTPVLVTTSILVLLFSLFYGQFKALAITCSNASDCQQQISNNNNQLNSSKQTLSQLSSQATSYQGAIDQLNGQITSLQSQIQSNQIKQSSIGAQIIDAQTKLNQQKSTLSEDLKSLYISGQITPIEMLATSNSISEYVDQQESYNAVQTKIQSTVKQISELQKSLQTDKLQVDNLLTTQQSQQSQLASAEYQQSNLLSYNESQQTQYNQQISTSVANISQLQSRLSALNDAGSSTFISSGKCGGGYPAKAVNPFAPNDGYGPFWGCNYPQDGSQDNWHMENRECVSYTAYVAYSKYGVSASRWGNAYQWITSAENHGYLVDQNPTAGAVAIRNRDYNEPGDVGHAMYVVSVNGSSSITVNEYNEHYNGQFDERTFDPSGYASRGGLYYIHF
jgi:surface antigen/peptidoglycan hydrolase CwlO-like protein